VSGWEAMQQGAPDPFFAEQRCTCRKHAWNPECPVHPRKREILGTGLTIIPCAECKHASFCSLAGACLRQKTRT
jgi:hypothetical protein